LGQKDRGRAARRRNLSVGVPRRSHNANVLPSGTSLNFAESLF